MERYAALGVPSFRMVSLEVPGRKSGKPMSTVLVLERYENREYLISMLGEGADWVKNVRAAGGSAVIRHGGRRAVRLVEVPAEERAPILKEYVRIAPGGRRHFPVGLEATVEEYGPIAAQYPVFRVEPAGDSAT